MSRGMAYRLPVTLRVRGMTTNAHRGGKACELGRVCITLQSYAVADVDAWISQGLAVVCTATMRNPRVPVCVCVCVCVRRQQLLDSHQQRGLAYRKVCEVTHTHTHTHALARSLAYRAYLSDIAIAGH